MHVRRRVLLSLAVALAPVAATAQSPAPALDASRAALAGSYELTQAGADSMQKLKLKLHADGKATLTTEYPGYTKTAAGTPVYPYREAGTWQDANGLAVVHFTQSAQIVDKAPTNERAEDKTLFFKRTGCSLKLAQDPTSAYGSRGLTFTKHHCI
jgi:hypothetical protein